MRKYFQGNIICGIGLLILIYLLRKGNVPVDLWIIGGYTIAVINILIGIADLTIMKGR